MAEVEDVRLFVYKSFSTTGRAPTVADIAAHFNQNVEDIKIAMKKLAEGRLMVLGADGEVVMAHPFSSVNLGFSVMGKKSLWWGGCCWDSFALAHLLPSEERVLVATNCPNCDTPHAWNVDRNSPPNGEQIAHFLVPAERMWDDVVFTCGNQRIFCNRTCLSTWLEKTGNKEGYIMDIKTLWKFSSKWYEGRLDRGYTRREPSAATEYKQWAGLSGSFWGM